MCRKIVLIVLETMTSFLSKKPFKAFKKKVDNAMGR